MKIFTATTRSTTLIRKSITGQHQTVIGKCSPGNQVRRVLLSVPPSDLWPSSVCWSRHSSRGSWTRPVQLKRWKMKLWNKVAMATHCSHVLQKKMYHKKGLATRIPNSSREKRLATQIPPNCNIPDSSELAAEMDFNWNCQKTSKIFSWTNM